MPAEAIQHNQYLAKGKPVMTGSTAYDGLWLL